MASDCKVDGDGGGCEDMARNRGPFREGAQASGMTLDRRFAAAYSGAMTMISPASALFPELPAGPVPACRAPPGAGA
jgi:hypothetical protein